MTFLHGARKRGSAPQRRRPRPHSSSCCLPAGCLRAAHSRRSARMWQPEPGSAPGRPACRLPALSLQLHPPPPPHPRAPPAFSRIPASAPICTRPPPPLLPALPNSSPVQRALCQHRVQGQRAADEEVAKDGKVGDPPHDGHRAVGELWCRGGRIAQGAAASARRVPQRDAGVRSCRPTGTTTCPHQKRSPAGCQTSAGSYGVGPRMLRSQHFGVK